MEQVTHSPEWVGLRRTSLLTRLENAGVAILLTLVTYWAQRLFGPGTGLWVDTLLQVALVLEVLSIFAPIELWLDPRRAVFRWVFAPMGVRLAIRECRMPDAPIYVEIEPVAGQFKATANCEGSKRIGISVNREEDRVRRDAESVAGWLGAQIIDLTRPQSEWRVAP